MTAKTLWRFLCVACLAAALLSFACAGKKGKQYEYVGYAKESIRTAFGDPNHKTQLRKNEEIWEYNRSGCKITFTIINDRVSSCHYTDPKCEDYM